MGAAVASRIKIMAGLDISERRLPQDGGIHVMMDKRPIDLRVSTMPGKHGEKVVIRILDQRGTSLADPALDARLLHASDRAGRSHRPCAAPPRAPPTA